MSYYSFYHPTEGRRLSRPILPLFCSVKNDAGGNDNDNCESITKSDITILDNCTYSASNDTSEIKR